MTVRVKSQRRARAPREFMGVSFPRFAKSRYQRIHKNYVNFAQGMLHSFIREGFCASSLDKPRNCYLTTAGIAVEIICAELEHIT